jgi:nucleosome binding factor SPN SPT16 subunit
MNNNVEVPLSLISFLLDIRAERKYNMMLHSLEIVKNYLESEECDEEGRNFLYDENRPFNFENYLEAQKQLFRYVKKGDTIASISFETRGGPKRT